MKNLMPWWLVQTERNLELPSVQNPSLPKTMHKSLTRPASLPSKQTLYKAFRNGDRLSAGFIKLMLLLMLLGLAQTASAGMSITNPGHFPVFLHSLLAGFIPLSALARCEKLYGELTNQCFFFQCAILSMGIAYAFGLISAVLFPLNIYLSGSLLVNGCLTPLAISALSLILHAAIWLHRR